LDPWVNLRQNDTFCASPPPFPITLF
jgi:hypothetical protein